ncbi:Aromatic-di-Alanine repeat protein [Dictyocaulus viviparus]|uniref:Aromatic-di-Alanine repeat protein n=1 Tax=Dictyocaulus viviparus TaxID=29172 RepID=A0A0D8Y9K7_DICVI|nr:Aromatic-di-Alanine repeat protein [Dictyocaulus viviparus]
MFINQKTLNIHSDEVHCPFYRLRVEKNPSGNHFQCYDEDCMKIFTTGEDRDDHCRKHHNINNVEFNIERRKLPKRVQKLEKTFNQMNLAPRRNRAGNLFKMAKLWKEGGDTFVKAAELHGAKGDSKHDCASQYAEAANCYRKVNPQLAVDCLLKTCEIYTDMGRFNMAAKTHVTIAELFETECPDVEQCIIHYQKAADYYKGEESKSSATKCLIKVAQYAAQLGQYQKAINVFEEIAMWEADHPTLKYAAKNHFFQALLCYLCIDQLDAQHALKRYEEASPSFTDSRESKFIKDLIACLEDGNEEMFTDTVKAFDKISRLDQWHTSLLVKVKKSINKDEEDDLK